MSQNEKRLFDRHKKQEEPPLEQTQAVPAVQDESAAEPAAEASPKRNKYADKMNRKKRRLSKGARIGITAAAVALLLGGGIWAVVKSRDAGTEDVTQTTAMVSCGDLETYIEGSGVTAAKKREELGREVKGKVTQVLVAEGDEVHTGDPLLVIDPTETRKELADAQKELTEAERGVSDAQLCRRADRHHHGYPEGTGRQGKSSRYRRHGPHDGGILRPHRRCGPEPDARGSASHLREQPRSV